VLFALKVLNNHYNPGRVSSVLGLRVPSRYACWVELVAIHVISPGTSFAGHLAGILVGLMYTMGPLKKIMEVCAGGFSSFADPHRPRNYYSGYSGYYRYPEDQYRAPRNYYDYTGGLTEEEQLERAVLNSLNERGKNSTACHLPDTVHSENMLLTAIKYCETGDYKKNVETHPGFYSKTIAVICIAIKSNLSNSLNITL
ncbi:UNVERIFIED_CONTAM: hypothetical protein H355_016650, partial [Colinus virginianus]